MTAAPDDGDPVPADGILVIDKPPGLTSHDVVARLRRIMGTRKVGHAGTLDPMATGVLVVGVNRATRLLTYIVGADKEYLATIRLGMATSTDDAEGEPTGGADASGLTTDLLEHQISLLTGAIDQVPSSVSAIKVNGVRAYASVRAGEKVHLAARSVTVSVFEVLAQEPGPQVLDLQVRVVCSSGTYVRALARDLGAALGVGGHLTALRRTRVGGYGLEAAMTLETLAQTREAGASPPVLTMGRAAAAVLDTRTLDRSETGELGFGRPLPATGSSEPVAALAPDGHLVAILRDAVVRGVPVAKPEVVFAPAPPPPTRDGTGG